MSSTGRKGSSKGSGGTAIRDKQHEMVGVVFFLAALLVLLSLVSFSPTDPVFESVGQKAANWIGLVGAYLAHVLLFSLGISSFLLVAALTYGSVVAFSKGGVPLSLRRVCGYLTLCVLGTIMFHIVFNGRLLMGHAPGGVVGEYAGALLISLLSTPGTVVLVTCGMLLALIEITGFSPVRTVLAASRGAALGARTGWSLTCRAATASGRAIGLASVWLYTRSKKEFKDLVASLRNREPRKAGSRRWSKPDIHAEPEVFLKTLPPGGEPGLSKPPVIDPAKQIMEPSASIPEPTGRREPLVVTSPPVTVPEAEESPEQPKAKRDFSKIKRDQEPEIVIPKALEKPDEPKEPQAPPPIDLQDYQLPEISFLDMQEQEKTMIEKDKLHEYARRLEEKLSDYGVGGRVTKIMPGPVVTMYEYAPAPGIKVSKIAGLSNDLALALEALSVRIIAPIPGRAVVGIEVANKVRQTVYAKEIVGHQSFQRGRSKLNLALGKDIEGTPFVTDLNKMPHLLVAGATGTGKSVALNSMITSILYRATPEDVRFIMVDPKVLELSLYEGIPHLLLPVVTDPRKAQAALHWAVCEMERRIQLLHGAGVRSLDNYNKKIEKLAEEDQADRKQKKKVIVIDNSGTESTIESAPPEDELALLEQESKPAEPKPQKLPHIVIVIDELADLMMSSSREVETAIARIAQKARAAGIHLIIATQRPSVNVITGLIKANLPARISFRVASKTDSRTILDQNGAETLLGNGDMLFHPPTSSQILRIHGALITEDEITRVVEHLKAQAQPVYDESILASAEEDEQGMVDEEEDHDELYDQAVRLVAEMGQASTSMVQRKLRIGYNRAARLIERMEREGIVGPADGSRPREVLIQDHPG